jgi:DNA-binding NarL/FixJ family response regulator
VNLDAASGQYGPMGSHSRRPEFRHTAGRDHASIWRATPRSVADPVSERRLDRTRILVVDDCTLDRENLAAVLITRCGAVPRFAWDAHSLKLALGHFAPHVVLVSLRTRDCLALLRGSLADHPRLPVIVTGVSEDDEVEIVACAEAGVAGYHTTSESLDHLLTAIGKALDGEFICSARVSAILLRRLTASNRETRPVTKELVLTSREAQILQMLELGLSNRDIAAQLCIAVHTVKNHVHNLLTKLGVSTRTEAASLARSLRTQRPSAD